MGLDNVAEEVMVIRDGELKVDKTFVPRWSWD